MKTLILCLSVISILAASSLFAADPPPAPRADIAPLMHLKLEKSKSILEGLALEDFEKIKSNARSLRLLSTESGWNVIQTQEYAAQSRDFQRSTDLMINAANEKNIQRTALGYVALTVRCVECHSYMRKHRIELMSVRSSDLEP
jgi:hypothetical protein